MIKLKALGKKVIPYRVVRMIRTTRRSMLHVPYLFKQSLRGQGTAAWPQTIFEIKTELALSSSVDIRAALNQLNLVWSEGGHTFYLPPQHALRQVVPGLPHDYPHEVGIKLIKGREISDDGTPYYTSSRLAPGSTRFTMKAVGSIRDKMIVANILSLYEAAPRVYDLVMLRHGADSLFAMIIQHVKGKCPEVGRGLSFISTLRAIIESEGIIVLGDGFAHKDFQPPNFNNNILEDNSANCYLVDFQNLAFRDLSESISKLLLTVQEVTHFGESRLWRPDKYNYQSIPYLDVPGKRDLMARAQRLTGMIADHSITGSTVLDVGCNLGMFGAYLLSQGAYWYVGIDRPPVTEVAQKLLYYSGYSRFELVGCDLRDPGVMHKVPFRQYDILLFLSMRKHIGLPEWLRDMDFKLLVYEGHEGETIAEASQLLQDHIAGLQSLGQAVWQDGDSPPRPVIVCRHKV